MVRRPVAPAPRRPPVKRRLTLNDDDHSESSAARGKRAPSTSLASDDRYLFAATWSVARAHSRSASEDSNGKGRKGDRKEASLLFLASQFVQVLRASNGGLVDLNEAAVQLNVAKRRVYDITNVLEGEKMVWRFDCHILQA